MSIETLKNTPPWDWDDDARHTILAVLRDHQHDPAERLLAAEFAAETVIANDNLVEELIALLLNPAESEDLRAQAAISLAPALEETELDMEDDDPYAEPPLTPEAYRQALATLERVYTDETAPKLVRRRALEAAVRTDAEWREDAVRTAWNSSDPEWKLTGAFCMAYVPGFGREIVDAINSDSDDIRYEGIRAGGSMQVDEAWPLIKKIASDRDEDKDLRIAAIEVAGQISLEESGELLEELTSDPDEEIVEAAEEALSEATFEDDLGDDD